METTPPAFEPSDDLSPPTNRDLIPSEMLDVPATKWPTVFGVISIIYGGMGMLCYVFQGAMIAILPTLPEMFRGGVEMPPILRITGAIQVIVTFGLGVFMLVGAARLLRRRRSGVAILKQWAVLRLVVLLLGVGAMVLTGPAQIHVQRSTLDFKNKMLEEQGRADRIEKKSDEQLWRLSMIQGGAAAVAFAIYPLVLGFYLSRRKVTEELEQWS